MTETVREMPAGEWEERFVAVEREGGVVDDFVARVYRGTGDNRFLVHESVAERLQSVGALVLHPENPRRGDLPTIRESLAYHGQYKEIVANRGTRSERYAPGTIGAGNHTYKSAIEEGWTHVGVTWVDVSDDELDRILAVDNRASDLGEYDPEVLAKVLTGLGSLEGTGYTDDFLADLLDEISPEKKEGLTDPDEVPDPPEEPVTERGHVWVLGPHRLLCGDSTEPDEVERLLERGEKVGMVFTDPPYGVDYVSRVDEKRRKPWGGIVNDDLKDQALGSLLTRALGPHAVVPRYVCCNWQSVVDFFAALGKPNSLIVWDKRSIGLGKGYRNQHEFVLFYGRLGHDAESNVWSLERDGRADYEHPTQKPVALAERAIGNSSRRGEIVLDLFAGSGSTLIAAERTGRACRAMEIDERYCDVICRRYQEHTGVVPVLEATGEPHDFAATT